MIFCVINITMNLYVIILIIVLMMTLFCTKIENMCNCGMGLDYIGYRKCLDWEETMRRRGGLFRTYRSPYLPRHPKT